VTYQLRRPKFRPHEGNYAAATPVVSRAASSDIDPQPLFTHSTELDVLSRQSAT